LSRRRDLARPVEAVVATYRRAVRRNSRRFAPSLAMSLHQLAMERAEQGRQMEALAATMEAVDIYRYLSHAEPERFAKPLDEALLLEDTLKTALGIAPGDDVDAAFDAAAEDLHARARRKAKRARVAVWGWSLAFWFWAFSAAAILWAGA
jgi:hypothetical protein